MTSSLAFSAAATAAAALLVFLGLTSACTPQSTISGLGFSGGEKRARISRRTELRMAALSQRTMRSTVVVIASQIMAESSSRLAALSARSIEPVDDSVDAAFRAEKEKNNFVTVAFSVLTSALTAIVWSSCFSLGAGTLTAELPALLANGAPMLGSATSVIGKAVGPSATRKLAEASVPSFFSFAIHALPVRPNSVRQELSLAGRETWRRAHLALHQRTARRDPRRSPSPGAHLACNSCHCPCQSPPRFRRHRA